MNHFAIKMGLHITYSYSNSWLGSLPHYEYEWYSYSHGLKFTV